VALAGDARRDFGAMSQNVPKGPVLREFFSVAGNLNILESAFLSEFSIWTSGQVVGAHGSQKRNILRHHQ